MDLELPEDARAVGQVCLAAFRDAGGVDLARRAALDPSLRRTVIAPLLDKLGVADISATSDDPAELLIAAEVCRAAGSVALPYPIAGILLAEPGGLPVAAIDDDDPRIDHGDLFERWHTVSANAGGATAKSSSPMLGSRLGPFVTSAVCDGPAPVDCSTDLLQRTIALNCIAAVGIGQQAMALTIEHAQTREQFGKPLAAFQSVRFKLAHASTILAGLVELGHYTIVRLARHEPATVVDALGLRMQTIAVVRDIMRTAHQLHGAVGFCTEHDLSVLTGALQPLTRLPFDASVTAEHLLRAVEEYGFDSTFPVPAHSGP